jgi:hypothetical protein
VANNHFSLFVVLRLCGEYSPVAKHVWIIIVALVNAHFDILRLHCSTFDIPCFPVGRTQHHDKPGKGMGLGRRFWVLIPFGLVAIP